MNETLTTLEIQKLFNVSAQTVYNWRKLGKLRSYKLGHRRLFKREDIEQLLIEDTQLKLDTTPRERTARELEFFEQLEANLTESESFELMFYPHAEREYHRLILDLARKYGVKIPKWFVAQCHHWKVSTDDKKTKK